MTTPQDRLSNPERPDLKTGDRVTYRGTNGTVTSEPHWAVTGYWFVDVRWDDMPGTSPEFAYALTPGPNHLPQR